MKTKAYIKTRNYLNIFKTHNVCFSNEIGMKNVSIIISETNKLFIVSLLRVEIFYILIFTYRCFTNVSMYN